MNTKFEKLSEKLFSHKINREEMKRTFGGQITYQRYETYVMLNGDYVNCGEDYRGKSCDAVQQYT